MLKLFAVTAKELLLLRRDRAGLLVLFLMPALLVVIITLVQENVMTLTGQKKTQILFLDQDGGELGRKLHAQLEAEGFAVISRDGQLADAAGICHEVTAGDFQAGMVVGPGSSSGFQGNIEHLLSGSGHGAEGTTTEPIIVQVFFDPGMLPGLRLGLTTRLQVALKILSLEAKIKALDSSLQEAMDMLSVPPEFFSLPDNGLSELFARPVLALDPVGIAAQSVGQEYNPVQQNVPAWALFAMFFTAIPMAGSLLQERQSGLWPRFTTLPVSPFLLFSGKILAYIGVCLCQFFLVGLIGAYLFPFLDLPAFSLAQNPAGAILIVLFASLAASGYGIFLGMICSSYEQASTLGATTVVAAAAIGGVMVPVYAMPEMMQQLSITSPLHWGVTAFQNLLVREAPLSDILPDLYRLGLFCILMLVAAWQAARQRTRYS